MCGAIVQLMLSGWRRCGGGCVRKELDFIDYTLLFIFNFVLMFFIVDWFAAKLRWMHEISSRVRALVDNLCMAAPPPVYNFISLLTNS